MLRLICVVVIQNCSMHLLIHKSLQSSVVNNNINWYIPWSVCSQRDLCFWTAEWLRWEDSCGDLPVQPSCLKHENLEQVLWDHVVRFWISLRMKPVALGRFLACLSNLTVRKNKFNQKRILKDDLSFDFVWLFVFENFKWKFLYFNRNAKTPKTPNSKHLCPFLLSHWGTLWKESIFLTPFHQIFIHFYKISVISLTKTFWNFLDTVH